MAGFAIGTELAFVWFVFLVAVKTGLRCFPVFFALHVTTGTRGLGVFSLQGVIGHVVIEGNRFDVDDRGAATAMFNVAAVAFRFRDKRVFAVKTRLFLEIGSNRLVATDAEIGLRFALQCLVAIGAIFFKLHMSRRQFAGHHELFNDICAACRKCKQRQHQSNN